MLTCRCSETAEFLQRTWGKPPLWAWVCFACVWMLDEITGLGGHSSALCVSASASTLDDFFILQDAGVSLVSLFLMFWCTAASWAHGLFTVVKSVQMHSLWCICLLLVPFPLISPFTFPYWCISSSFALRFLPFSFLLSFPFTFLLPFISLYLYFYISSFIFLPFSFCLFFPFSFIFNFITLLISSIPFLLLPLSSFIPNFISIFFSFSFSFPFSFEFCNFLTLFSIFIFLFFHSSFYCHSFKLYTFSFSFFPFLFLFLSHPLSCSFLPVLQTLLTNWCLCSPGCLCVCVCVCLAPAGVNCGAVVESRWAESSAGGFGLWALH